jgi:hypothetical protein
LNAKLFVLPCLRLAAALFLSAGLTRYSALFADGCVVAIVEERFPLDLLNIEAVVAKFGLAVYGGFAEIDEVERIPGGIGTWPRLSETRMRIFATAKL